MNLTLNLKLCPILSFSKSYCPKLDLLCPGKTVDKDKWHQFLVLCYKVDAAHISDTSGQVWEVWDSG